MSESTPMVPAGLLEAIAARKAANTKLLAASIAYEDAKRAQAAERSDLTLKHNDALIPFHAAHAEAQKEVSAATEAVNKALAALEA